MKRKLVAAIACRNKGSRLYGKPLQNLDVEDGITVIDNIIDHLNKIEIIDEIVLGIANGIENEVYIEIAKNKKIQFIKGDENDVLQRLIKCGEKVNATDIFRITSESPFMYYQSVKNLWELYLNKKLDAIFQDDIVDGCGFEIISMKALKTSHLRGDEKHRSELCTLFIRENPDKFNVVKVKASEKLNRKDLRLTVDNPEDLIVCRELYQQFKDQAPKLNIHSLIDYLDANPHLKDLVSKYTEDGYNTMYI
tara:strand:+ start:701 stop:1453 length:753 start_codon:yes stop_codon:yes gene_type:complete